MKPTLTHADGRSVLGLGPVAAISYDLPKKNLSILEGKKYHLVKNNF